jgi:hypothetical protein
MENNKLKEESDVEYIQDCGFNKSTNSTGTFVPPYWSFVYSDSNLRDYVCVTVNVPSGLCHKKYGLQDKIEAKISTCGTKLNIAIEWPYTMVDN